MEKPKPLNVKIIQIVLKEDHIVFGLGSDDLVYRYDPEESVWLLYTTEGLTF